jgi:putative Mn2+ efflux pump MntP
MELLEILILAIGVSMDAFAVSVCKGMTVETKGWKEGMICGVWFGAFQVLMPMLGFLAGSRFERIIRLAAPWVAFILLVFVGVNMIRESYEEDERKKKAGYGFVTMLILAVATAIDALAVGVTFVAVPVEILAGGELQNALLASVILGIVTCIVSNVGVHTGRLFGDRYRSGSVVLGGFLLIAIAFLNLIRGVLGDFL